jgi:methionyl-tRNA synthetase
LDTVLWYAMESTRLAALMLQPFIPTKAAEVLDQLTVAEDERSWAFAEIGRGWETKDGQQRRLNAEACLPVFPQLKLQK